MHRRRETALTGVLERSLKLVPGSIEHDHIATTMRGEIAVFWLKIGGGK